MFPISGMGAGSLGSALSGFGSMLPFGPQGGGVHGTGDGLAKGGAMSGLSSLLSAGGGSSGSESLLPKQISPFGRSFASEILSGLQTFLGGGSLNQMMGGAGLGAARGGGESAQNAGGSSQGDGSGIAKSTGSDEGADGRTQNSGEAEHGSGEAQQGSGEAEPENSAAGDGSEGPGPSSTGLGQAQANTHAQFAPVLRGDEQQLDAKVTNEHQFGQLADQVARQYGLDPAMFRAQLQAESGAFNSPTSYQSSQNLVGDKDRAASHNESLGLGQISRNFLDNGPWAKGGPGNPRVGGQTVTKAEYDHSVTVQLRMAASNDAQRIADNGGNVRAGLASYVNGSPDASAPKAAAYLANIDRYMRDQNVERV